MGITINIDPIKMMGVAQHIVRRLLPEPMTVERDAVLPGYAGVYSSFLLNARKVAEQFGVAAQDILIEVGRRRAVGDQEDLVTEVAAELARASGA